MPNYAYNTVYFKPEDVEKVMELVVTEDNQFDFNRIIPMPESLMLHSGSITSDAEDLLGLRKLDSILERYPDEGEEPDPSVFYNYGATPKTLPELRVFARLILSNKKQYGFTDWYDWAYANWDTKWNAFDAEWEGNVCRFSTAWSHPNNIFMQLSKMLGIEFRVEVEEESLAYCMKATYDCGEMTEYEEAEGYAGLALLGESYEDIVARYEEWYDENEMADLKKELDEIFS